MKDKHTRNDRETAQGKIRLKKCLKTKQVNAARLVEMKRKKDDQRI